MRKNNHKIKDLQMLICQNPWYINVWRFALCQQKQCQIMEKVPAKHWNYYNTRHETVFLLRFTPFFQKDNIIFGGELK